MNLDFYSPLQPFLSKASLRAKMIKDFKQVSTICIYDHVLALQTLVTAREDFLFFAKQSAWNKAKSVLDLGCAGGHYLNFLANFFPKKKFVGIDVDNTFLSLAKEHFPKIAKFAYADASTFNTNTFDYLIARALLQHLTDEQYCAFINSLQSTLKPSARLAFFDADPNFKFIHYPNIPSIKNIRRKIATWQRKRGGDRNRLEHFIANCSRYGFEIEWHEKPQSACINEFDKDLFARYELAKAALIAKRYNVSLDLSAVVKDLSVWLSTPHSYAATSIGQWVVVKKKG